MQLRNTEDRIGERVLPWYKGKGKEMGKTPFFRCTQSNTEMEHIGDIVLIIGSVHMTLLLCVHSRFDVLPFSILFPLYQGNTLSLSLLPLFL